MDETSAQLVDRFRRGDEGAADELFQRYLTRLLALARSRLSPKLARRLDPEDVVQSAYRSFFTGLKNDRYTISESDDLWSLLASITLHKLHKQVDRHTAAKRDIRADQSMALSTSLFASRPEALNAEPTPSEVMGVSEELEIVMKDLDSTQRRMLELRLQGYGLAEISSQTKRSERTVRRLLAKIKDGLEQRLLSELPA